MSERWLRAAILQNLPDIVAKSLAIELKRATSIEDMYNTINTYTFDHRTGLPRGQTSPMLYLTERPVPENVREIANVAENKNPDKDSHQSQQEDTKTACTTNKEDDTS